VAKAAVAAASAACCAALAARVLDLAEAGEEVGARFDDEAKAAASSGIADVLLSLRRAEVCNAASCMTETEGGADGRLVPAMLSCADRAFRAFFAVSAASCLAGEGGG